MSVDDARQLAPEHERAASRLVLTEASQDGGLSLQDAGRLLHDGATKSSSAATPPPTTEAEVDDPAAQEIDGAWQHHRNVIFFGPPSTGESYALRSASRTHLKAQESDTFRVTFHPEYSYFDFIGSYKPVTGWLGADGWLGVVPEPAASATTSCEPRVLYRFDPGPFSLALKRAALHPERNVILIIEEINRGNCAAIFGDIFQLLDRSASGGSEYPIHASSELAGWLNGQNLASKSWQDGRLRLPSNLYLWATMNTSDQSLFPMDTAFRRRWGMEYIGIRSDGAANRKAIVMLHGGDDRPVAWVDLMAELNTIIVRHTHTDDKEIFRPEIIANVRFSSDEQEEHDEGSDRIDQTTRVDGPAAGGQRWAADMSLGARHAIAREPLSSWFQVERLPVHLRSRFTRCSGQADGWSCDQPGFLLIDGRLGVVFPRAFAGADEPASVADAFALVRSLSQYRRERIQTSVQDSFDELSVGSAGIESAGIESAGIESADDDLDHLEVAMELWADYRAFGPLRVSSRETGSNVRGRVDWSATIRRSPAAHGPHGVIYGHPIQTRTAISPADPLTTLHVATASVAGAMLGAGAHVAAPNGREARQLLKGVERALYADRARHVHALLWRYYAGGAGRDGGQAAPGGALFATSFAHVWERMVFVALGASSPKDTPNGDYHDVAGHVSAGLRGTPDGVVDARVNCQRVQIMMDAKHYKHGHLPKSESLNKQIVYRLMLSDRLKPGGLSLDVSVRYHPQ